MIKRPLDEFSQAVTPAVDVVQKPLGGLFNSEPNTEVIANQQIVTRELQQITTSEASSIDSPNWGAIEDLDPSDFLVPRIYHQQANSDFVKKRAAQAGNFCDSITGDVLATDKLEVIIFASFKNLVVRKQVDIKGKTSFEYVETLTVTTPESAMLIASKPYFEDIGNGEVLQNTLQYNYYCLVVDKIMHPPFVITFKGTKVKTAKKLNSMLRNLSSLGKNGASKVFTLNSIEVQSEEKSWLGLEAHVSRDSTMEELRTAFKWYNIYKQNKLVVREEEDEEHKTVAPMQDSYSTNLDDDLNTNLSDDDLPF